MLKRLDHCDLPWSVLKDLETLRERTGDKGLGLWSTPNGMQVGNPETRLWVYPTSATINLLGWITGQEFDEETMEVVL